MKQTIESLESKLTPIGKAIQSTMLNFFRDAEEISFAAIYDVAERNGLKQLSPEIAENVYHIISRKLKEMDFAIIDDEIASFLKKDVDFYKVQSLWRKRLVFHPKENLTHLYHQTQMQKIYRKMSENARFNL